MAVSKGSSDQKDLLPVFSRIVSGGQTGADRAALDWAIAQGFDHGGWCPKGRLAEDGVLDARYQLKQTDSENYFERTERNVLDSDGTLIFNSGELEGGTLRTVRFAETHRKPCLVLQLDEGICLEDIARVLAWLRAESIRTLNIAGPRESERPGTYERTQEFLSGLANYQRGKL